jgi:hypothetical protein
MIEIQKVRTKLFAVLLFSAVLLNSCAGADASIVIRRDGSGTIALEYRIARVLESLGKLDGNERWLPIPVGSADFERTVARVPGLTLNSFSSKQTERDIICQVKLNFANIEALASFMDASGQRAVPVRNGERTGLILSFGGYRTNTDTELLALASSVTEGYGLGLRFALPAEASCRVLDTFGTGKAAPPAGTLNVQGSQVDYTASMADILGSAEPVILEILW